MTESALQARIRQIYSERGWRLWRNNVGAFKTTDGGFVRYGLCNDSAAMNKRLKSSDLVGIRPVTVTDAMVGKIIGQFVAIECKHPGWQYKGTDRERAQLRFLDLILSLGGYGRFESDV